MVGMSRCSVIARARPAGTSSSTIANAPAAAWARAPSTIACAAESLTPCTRYPPSACAVCGVSPTCAITGKPRVVRGLRHLGRVGAALQLDGGCSAPLQQTRGVPQRGVNRGIGHEGKIRDDQRGRYGARHGGGVVHDVADRTGSSLACPSTVRPTLSPTQQGVHAGAFGQLGKGRVVGRHAHQGVACALARAELGNGHGQDSAAARRGRIVARPRGTRRQTVGRALGPSTCAVRRATSPPAPCADGQVSAAAVRGRGRTRRRGP